MQRLQEVEQTTDKHPGNARPTGRFSWQRIANGGTMTPTTTQRTDTQEWARQTKAKRVLTGKQTGW